MLLSVSVAGRAGCAAAFGRGAAEGIGQLHQGRAAAPHRHTGARGAEHIQVVCPVPEAEAPGTGDAQIAVDHPQGAALAAAGGQKLQVPAAVPAALLHRPGKPGQLLCRLPDDLLRADQADLVHRRPAQVQSGEVVLVADAVVPADQFGLGAAQQLALKVLRVELGCTFVHENAALRFHCKTGSVPPGQAQGGFGSPAQEMGPAQRAAPDADITAAPGDQPVGGKAADVRLDAGRISAGAQYNIDASGLALLQSLRGLGRHAPHLVPEGAVDVQIDDAGHRHPFFLVVWFSVALW